MALRAARFSLKDWIASHANGLACGLLAVASLSPVVAAGRAAAISPILLVLAGSAAALVTGAAAAWLAPSVFLGSAGSAFLRSGFQDLTRRR
jgi:hypothetical protein